MHKLLTKNEQRDYIRNGADSCPYCQSNKVEGQEVNIGTIYAEQTMSCTECERYWRACFKLCSVDQWNEGGDYIDGSVFGIMPDYLLDALKRYQEELS